MGIEAKTAKLEHQIDYSLCSSSKYILFFSAATQSSSIQIDIYKSRSCHYFFAIRLFFFRARSLSRFLFFSVLLLLHMQYDTIIIFHVFSCCVFSLIFSFGTECDVVDFVFNVLIYGVFFK